MASISPPVSLGDEDSAAEVAAYFPASPVVTGEWVRPVPSTLARRRILGEVRLRAELRRVGLRLACALAAIVLLLALALVLFRSAYDDRVYPAVYVADQDLGGLTRDEARAVLASQAVAIERGLVTFTYDGRTWTPTLAELGGRVDVEASLDAAMAVGREAEADDRLWATGLLVREDRRLPLVLTIDRAVLDGWLDGVANELGFFPHEARLVIEGTTVRIEPEVEGITIDRPRAHESIRAALAGLQPTTVPLPVTPWIARVRAGDLEEARARVEQALARPVEVTFEGRTWMIEPADLGRFVVQGVNPDPALTGRAAVVLEVDEGALAGWLDEQFGAEVNREPVDAEVAWNGERVVAMSKSVDGFRLRPKSFARDVRASFFGDHRPVEVPVSIIAPEVRSDNLDALGITTLLARGDSNYDDGGATSPRDQNIEVGVSLLTGTLVPPHAEFSFNRAIGEITADKGYVESSVVQAERVGRDIGGGICQVSTTVFRAALLAGLPITEWWPHTYQIVQYEHDGWGPGFDASILQPEGDPFGGGDFKFLNPTDSWMLVEAVADGIHVVVTIYGPDLGYEVEISDTVAGEPIVEGYNQEVVNPDLPPGSIVQTEYTIAGREVSFIRWVYDRDGTLLEEREFYTRFKGRGDLYQVSPDMAGQSPAAY